MPHSRFVLRRARPDDAVAVHALLATAGEALGRQGFRNWLSPYPVDRILHDIDVRDVFVVEDRSELAATFTLGREAIPPYVPEPWPVPTLEALYLNRLAVHPSRQGEGLGSWCMTRIAEHTRVAGAAAVRCDVLAANRVLCAFYERHGYVERGRRSRSGFEFACYELLTSNLVRP
jgi:ribosomal protein S18 acetylase RimI-like enzyme